MIEWRIIEEATNYEVSNGGQVRNRTTQQILKGRPTKTGYLQVSLKIDSTQNFTNRYIHRLVAQAFIPQTNESQKEVNHKDGNKNNNTVENLEWVTSKENTVHRYNVLHEYNTSSRKIGMYDKHTGELLKTFDSIISASRFFQKSRVNIDNALKHKKNQQTAYGFVWKYLD